MRSVLLCVFFALIIHNGSRASDSEFRPIPIPLDAWNYERREGRVGTLQESLGTDAPPAVAAVPAHYWEDALRHSVYLTLVRDKIDQLIARGVVISPAAKPDQYVSKEIDDHDLWEKIKRAPFDRLKEDDRLTFGDVTVMAKGRLMEDNGGYRFAEDDRSKDDCSDDRCMKGVKAFWSVKRVRQRDVETSPGKYHYELTFSVNSQPPKKQRKPYENPVRTFTVRENNSDAALGTPQEHPAQQPARPQAARPQRAVWFHKNIAPKSYYQGRYYNQGLDRIFSSLFSDDEPEPVPRYKVNPYPPPMPPMYHPQYSKAGYVGLPTDQHQQKRLMPYSYKPHHMYKYRPPMPPPPLGVQQHFIDVDVVKHPYAQPPAQDHRYISPSNVVKTTRPAVLPTPPAPYPNTTPDLSLDVYNNKTTIFEETTNISDVPTTHPTPVYKPHSKPRPPVKASYFPEHIRPPIYNAPPGVFLTMDKKPFKPMPPLKHGHHSKPLKKPIDFRPSPQLIDGKFTDPDPEIESVFRPILMNNRTQTDSTEDIEVTKPNQKRKQPAKKPPKKHENIKWQQVTTSAPDIITVNSESGEDDTMQWADVLGAFSKTTPMHSQSDKRPEITTPMSPVVPKKETTTSTEVYEEPTTKNTSTETPALKKRTRPPPKFVKPERVKKHKRITTTTTSTTTTTTTTKAPETLTIKKPSDLTPQASSAATHAPKSWKQKNKTSTAAPTTQPPPTTTTATTQSPTTKNLPPPDTTPKTEPVVRPKNKNRFRLTTLMQKGTSVKHDRWSTNYTVPDKKPSVPPTGKSPARRKGSNFQGHVSSTNKYSTRDDGDFRRGTHSHEHDTRSSTETITTEMPTQSSYEEIPVHFHVEPTSGYTQNRNEETDEDNEADDDDEKHDMDTKTNTYEQETADQAEFIFDLTSKATKDRTNEIIEEESIVTEQTVVATTHAPAKNKTKCKKKKHHHLTPTTTVQFEEDEQSTSPSPEPTKPSSSGMDLFDELIGSLTTYDESTEKATVKKQTRQELDEEESENHEKYLKLDEDFEEFLGNLDGKHRHGHSDDVEYEDEEGETAADDDDDLSPFDNEDVNEADHARDSHDKDYDDYRERSYSFLELMAME